MLLLSLTCPVAWAQNPAGAEFQVNSYTTAKQVGPAVASDANGNFVVVWTSHYQDGSDYGIFGQRFSAAGLPQGSEFQVNSYATGNQYRPRVASDANGNFVVVWESVGQDGSGYGVFGQRFNAAGVPQGSEFQVNSYTTGSQFDTAVASYATGNFVVVWRSSGQDGCADCIFGQRFDASGIPQASEFQVNSYTAGGQFLPEVASDASGNFVVVWTSNGQDGSCFGVFGQRFHAFGLPLGSEFQVNSFTTGNQAFPAVASDATGNFVVVWQSYGQDGSGYGVFGQRFNASGVPQGSEFRASYQHHSAPSASPPWPRTRLRTSSSSGSSNLPGRERLRRLRPALQRLRDSPRGPSSGSTPTPRAASTVPTVDLGRRAGTSSSLWTSN